MVEFQGSASSIVYYKTELVRLGALGSFRWRRPYVHPVRLRRRALQAATDYGMKLLSHTVVKGLENIPNKGPLLVLPNHVSNIDGLLVLGMFPRQLEMVGPGDFKMITLKDWVLRAWGMTMIRRGFADLDGLKALVNHLRNGRDLLMFPSGGMWEKRRFECKPGAAYLSQMTGTAILPVAIGGTYLKTKPMFSLRHPRLSITFGEVMPAVPPSANRRAREADFEAANQEIMARIWDIMEPEDRALYQQWEHEVFQLQLDFARFDDGEPVAYDGPALPDLAALAEFMGKPNLFRPMWQNAELPVEPFMERRFFAPIELQMAVCRLLETLRAGSYERYLPYRMGDDATAQVIAGLQALCGVAEWAMQRDVQVRLIALATDPATRETRVCETLA
ncbi:MAG: 1-acyl-sn-glycerol-3-phosphate acyltransferase [Anaerolineae bacterium]|nr:1-acyl-sn-glycerol-3-phosphate acyltransferase [Anaerolineae bacterium]